jgi:8-oxo-dGTP diphosphatase
MTCYGTPPKHPRVGVACIVERDGKVLLGKRKGAHAVGYWGFPGGHLEFGESVEACAKRELLEETGLISLSVRQGTWVENLMEEGQKHYITLFAYMDHWSGDPALLEPNKCEGWEWFSWDALPEPLFSPIVSLLAKERCQTLQTSDGKIAYTDSGGPGFPVVLIHGNSCSSAVFKKQLASFSKEYRLIAVDLPGHGKSDNAKHLETYSIPGYAKILDELVHHLNLKQFGVIGYSLGGNIALQWTQLNPSIKGVMIIATAPMMYSQEAYLAYLPYEGNYSAHPEPLTEAQATEYMNACGFHDRFMIEDAMRTDGKSRAQMVASILQGQGIHEPQIVSNLAIPLAVIAGAKDRALNLDYISNLTYRNLWRNQLTLIPNAQHAIIYTQADQLQPLITDFLKDIQ